MFGPFKLFILSIYISIFIANVIRYGRYSFMLGAGFIMIRPFRYMYGLPMKRFSNETYPNSNSQTPYFTIILCGALKRFKKKRIQLV